MSKLGKPQLKFYNTLNNKVEDFYTIKKNEVKMYTCGPTVYSTAHIGNFRAYVFMDVIRRVLKYNDYNVKTVMNITDVGHLTDDEDSGEDKMELSAKKENKTPYEIANRYTEQFFEDAKQLNIDFSDIKVVKATDHVKEMIVLVKDILKHGYAYEVNGTIYFDVEKYNQDFENKYGELSGLDLNEQMAGARIDLNKDKKNPHDFALWIKAPKEHIMKWNFEYPDGRVEEGYPGWHIECSALGRTYLGERFDIHTGGVDHIPVHHENEIAQSRAASCDHQYTQANFWMHCEFLKVDNGKMSKSLGNVYTIFDLKTKNLSEEEKFEYSMLAAKKEKTLEEEVKLEYLEEMSYSGLDYRYFLLNANFRNPQNFTWNALESAKTSRQNLISLLLKHKKVEEKLSNEQYDESIIEDFYNAVNFDLNIPYALSLLWELVNEWPKNRRTYEVALEMDKILGLELKNEVEKLEEQNKIRQVIPMNIQELALKRWQAKQSKDFKTSDDLRDEIKNLGYTIKDSVNGYEITKD